MKRVLITGMSGTGKSAAVAELVARGYNAVDLDSDEWSEWVPVDGNPTGANPGHDWMWREDSVLWTACWRCCDNAFRIGRMTTPASVMTW